MYKYLATITTVAILISSVSINSVLAKDDSAPLKLLNQPHSLIGKIWSTKDKKFTSQEALLKAVYQSEYVLLGETHDNTKHHADHGNMITKIAAQSKQAAVAFEMLNQDHANVINNVEFDSTDELLNTLEQAKTGWEYKKYYQPVFDSVFRAKLAMYAAEISRETLMQIVTRGIEQAPEEVQSLLKKTKLSAESVESLNKEIEMTHCGMINEEMTKAMMLGQQVRDAAIANALYTMKKSPVETAILVAGSGHIRNDRGAPLYLKTLDKNAKITSVAWLEIDTETSDPQAYSERWGSTQLPFDFVVFTDQVDRPDPCEEMKKFMEHKKDHGKKT